MENREEVLKSISEANTILVIQGENPDGDSLASSLAIEEILGKAGKKVKMFCAVDIPAHLRYMKGWDRVEKDLPRDFDLTIVVDTASESLLEKTFTNENLGLLRRVELIIMDHHDIESTMPFAATEYVDIESAATGELIFNLFNGAYEVSLVAKKFLMQSILYDTRGMSTESTKPRTIRLVADFVEAGVSIAELDEARMSMSKRDWDIAKYKGELLQRIEYNLDVGLATVDITWDEIEKYSPRYNPAVLVLDEMRMVNGVHLAIAYKTYPDGKILAKIRSNQAAPIASLLAEHFGGGGHPYAAGFKLFDREFSSVKVEVEKRYIELMKDIGKGQDDA